MLVSKDQILPCFLVDEVAIPAAVAKLREAIALIQETWPDPSEAEASAKLLNDAVDSAVTPCTLEVPWCRKRSSSE